MARAPKSPKKVTTGSRTGLRKREKVEYNLVKLSLPPKVPKKKVAVKKTVKKAKTTKQAPKGPSYLTLVKRALAQLDEYETASVIHIMHFLEKNHPSKQNRRFVHLALDRAVEDKVVVQQKQSFRLVKKEHERLHKKETLKKRKRSTSKKTAGKSSKTKKTVTAGKSTKTKKKTTSATDKAKKKKTTSASTSSSSKSKKRVAAEEAPAKKPPTKKAKTTNSSSSSSAKSTDGVIGPNTEGDVTGGAAIGGELRGVWQYYDNGWYDYDLGASAIVEGVYKEYEANPGMGLDVRAVQSGHFRYLVDFLKLTQKNIDTGTERRIRRS